MRFCRPYRDFNRCSTTWTQDLRPGLLSDAPTGALVEAPGLGALGRDRSVGCSAHESNRPQQTALAYATGGRVAVNPTPTEAQKTAGNYQKAHIRIHGLDISIENPKGSYRTGVHAGKPWRVRMPADYGYIRGTTGADGDHVDCSSGLTISQRRFSSSIRKT